MAQMYRILGKRGRVTIPYEIRQRVGFSQNDVLSFTESPDGRTVLVKREKLCDDNCKTERAQQRKEETDSVTMQKRRSNDHEGETRQWKKEPFQAGASKPGKPLSVS